MPDPLIGSDAIGRAMPDVHAALEHLVSAWAHLHMVEQIVGFEITTGELADLAGGLDTPKGVRTAVSQAVVADWLEEIRHVAK